MLMYYCNYKRKYYTEKRDLTMGTPTPFNYVRDAFTVPRIYLYY